MLWLFCANTRICDSDHEKLLTLSSCLQTNASAHSLWPYSQGYSGSRFISFASYKYQTLRHGQSFFIYPGAFEDSDIRRESVCGLNGDFSRSARSTRLSATKRVGVRRSWANDIWPRQTPLLSPSCRSIPIYCKALSRTFQFAISFGSNSVSRIQDLHPVPPLSCFMVSRSINPGRWFTLCLHRKWISYLAPYPHWERVCSSGVQCSIGFL